MNEVGLLPHTIEKLMDNTPNFNTYNYKTLRGNTGVNLCNLRSSNGFLDITLKAQLMIEKINRTTQNYSHVCCKRYHQESENTIHKWEKIYHIANYIPHKGFVSYCFKNHKSQQ